MEHPSKFLSEYPELKAKTHSEVAEEYDIDVKTLYNWIKKAGLEIPPTLILPCHLVLIYNTFGTPMRLKRK